MGFTGDISVRFATGNPFSALEPPVVWIRQNHIHNNIIVTRRVETRKTETKKRKHPAAGKNRNNKLLFKKQIK